MSITIKTLFKAKTYYFSLTHIYAQNSIKAVKKTGQKNITFFLNAHQPV